MLVLNIVIIGFRYILWRIVLVGLWFGTNVDLDSSYIISTNQRIVS